jgi:hypothetical protein
MKNNKMKMKIFYLIKGAHTKRAKKTLTLINKN